MLLGQADTTLGDGGHSMLVILRIHLPQTVVALIALLLFAACSSGTAIEARSAEKSDSSARSALSGVQGASTAGVQEAYATLPLSFEANVGQTDAQVDFLARGSGYTMFLTRGDAVLALRAALEPSSATTRGELLGTRGPGSRSVTPVAALRMHVLGGTPAARATPERELPGAVNYFIGNDPTKWHVGVPIFARITYPDISPGIDLVYRGNEGSLEYDFVVRPGADPSAIGLRYEGASELTIDTGGDVLLRIGDEHIRQIKPTIYQEFDGERREIVGAYLLRAGSGLGFEVSDYDNTRPLVIDPTLVYSTYLGGSGADSGQGIAVDSSGSAYVVGVT